eukprot:363651-Chlamydomonas_euryale.AAC.5
MVGDAPVLCMMVGATLQPVVKSRLLIAHIQRGMLSTRLTSAPVSPPRPQKSARPRRRESRRSTPTGFRCVHGGEGGMPPRAAGVFEEHARASPRHESIRRI